MCRWKSVKQIQHIYPLDQSYKVSLFSRCENDYIRGSGEIKQIQSISANICWVFTKHFHCQYCVWKYVYVWCWEVWSWHMLLRCRAGRVSDVWMDTARSLDQTCFSSHIITSSSAQHSVLTLPHQRILHSLVILASDLVTVYHPIILSLWSEMWNCDKPCIPLCFCRNCQQKCTIKPF